MRSVRARKVLRDLWSHPGRTVLVVVSIAVGVFALSVTLRTRALLARTVLDGYATINPADITFATTPFSDTLVEAVRGVPGVRLAQGQSRLQTRIQIGDEWRPIVLATADFNAMQINRVFRASGAWPPVDDALVLERSYAEAARIFPGETRLIEAADGEKRAVPITGLAHDLTALPGQISSSVVFGYVSRAGMARLGQTGSFNELQIVVDDPAPISVQQVAARVRRVVETNGSTVGATIIQTADQPAFYRTIEAILLMLGALGVLSLVLSALLVINTMTALITQQIPQIGVLKAIGARQRDLLAIYGSMVLVIALLALVVGIPLGAAAAVLLTQRLAALINYDVISYAIPWSVVALELGAGLVMPVLASLYPMLVGTRISVREAITRQGAEQFGRSRLDRWLGNAGGLPMSVLYALRNLFRRRVRLALTLLALSLGGAIVIGVLGVRASLFATLDAIADYWQQDITVMFDRVQPEDRISADVLQVAGVADVRFQIDTLGVRVRPDGSEAQDASVMFAVDPTSALLRPTLLQGRWLAPDDRDALVVNINFLDQEPDVQLGDRVTLKINDRLTTWRVVGVVMSQVVDVVPPKIGQPNVYVTGAAFNELMGARGYANRALITTTQHDGAFQKAVAHRLQTLFDQRNMRGTILTRAEAREQIAGTYRTIVLVLLLMALLFIVVGALGLMGAMSLNVVERTAEIGILRAIGASSGSVLRIVVIEGVFVGILSWLIAALLALPLSRMLSDSIGISLLKSPLAYTFPPLAIALWLVIVIVIAVAASVLPGRNATRVAVRDVLLRE